MVGGTTHSRAIRKWFDQTTEVEWFWLGEGPECVDPEDRGVRKIGDSLTKGINRLQSIMVDLDSSHQVDWINRWIEIDRRLAELDQTGHQGLWGGVIGPTLREALESSVHQANQSSNRDCADLVIASSMAFRDHDMTWRPRSRSNDHPLARCWVNRGANGIDGTFSTGLGIALGTQSSQPLIIWLGDLASFHDMQGLHGLAQWSHQQQQRPVII